MRAERRYDCTLTLVNVAAEERFGELSAIVSNVSRNGLRLHLNSPLPKGSTAVVRFGQIIATGRICYCHMTKSESFCAGMEILSVATCLN